VSTISRFQCRLIVFVHLTLCFFFLLLHWKGQTFSGYKPPLRDVKNDCKPILRNVKNDYKSVSRDVEDNYKPLLGYVKNRHKPVLGDVERHYKTVIEGR
jgi:hypothetical protein